MTMAGTSAPLRRSCYVLSEGEVTDLYRREEPLTEGTYALEYRRNKGSGWSADVSMPAFLSALPRASSVGARCNLQSWSVSRAVCGGERHYTEDFAYWT